MASQLRWPAPCLAVRLMLCAAVVHASLAIAVSAGAVSVQHPYPPASQLHPWSSQFLGSSRRLQQAAPPHAAPPGGKPHAPAAAPAKTPTAAKAPAAGAAKVPAAGAAPRAAAPAHEPTCKWDPETNTCGPTNAAWLVHGGRPSSPYRRAVLAAAAREQLCARHAVAAPCNADVRHRCFWVPAGRTNATTAGTCESSDLEEMLLFAGKANQPSMAVIPHALTCPGSAARSFYECYAFAGPPGACARGRPQCMVLASFGAATNVCVPKAAFGQRQPLGKVRLLLQGLEALSPSVFGSCEAACWLRQALECSKRNKEQCKKLPFCVYQDPELGRPGTGPLWADESDEDGLDNDSSTSASEAGGGGGVSSRLASAKALKAPPCRRQAQEFAPGNPTDQAAQAIYKECKEAATAAACEKVSAQLTAAAAAKLAAARATTAATRTAAAAAAKAPAWADYTPTAAAVKCELPLPTAAAVALRQHQ